jgi:hypothetical protein
MQADMPYAVPMTTRFNVAKFVSDVENALQKRNREAWLAQKPPRTRQVVAAGEFLTSDSKRRAAALAQRGR